MSRRHWRLDARRWAAARRMVFERDGHRCRKCGRAARLECDHIVPLEQDKDQNPYDSDNLQTLCRACHMAKTARENRRPVSAERKAWLDLLRQGI